MKKHFFCTLPLPILLLGCSAGNVASSIATPTTQPAVVNPSVALTSSYQSQGEMFETTFNVCNPECHLSFKAVTWGRPTQVGFLYYTSVLDGHRGWLMTTAKMPDPKNANGDLMRSKLVFKSSGAVPPLSTPSAEQKFAPVFAPGPTGLTLPSALQNSIKNGGRVEIVSVRRMTSEEEEVKVQQALAMPKGIPRAGDSLESYSVSLWDYYQAVKGKPDDLKPQQVENITWQDGQPPQIIPIKAW